MNEEERGWGIRGKPLMSISLWNQMQTRNNKRFSFNDRPFFFQKRTPFFFFFTAGNWFYVAVLALRHGVESVGSPWAEVLVASEVG